MARYPMPSPERLREFLEYDPATGILKWKTQRRGGPKGGVKGRVAGKTTGNGYVMLTVDLKPRLAHRVIWTMVHGTIPDGMHIDHINGDRADNRLVNLRLASPSENQWNSGVRKSRGGLKGAYYAPNTGKWYASVTVRGEKHHLGSFDTEQLAHEAYVEAAKRLHGEFARAA